MSDAKTQSEPSMEEILASIRRIISEDSKTDAKKAEAPKVEPVKAKRPAEDVLELTEMVSDDGTVVSLKTNGKDEGAVAAPSPPEPPQQSAAATAEVDPEPEPEPESEPEAEPEPAPPPAAADSLLSATAAAATQAAFSTLASAIDRADGGISIGVGTRTLEDLVKEVMRPLLKNWLDANLPRLTERIVRQEVERIARRAEEG